ncbi:acyl carrier protein [Catellatospora methionotrophica]|uniref:acyl carrier protein n=1 Tax=Catellatospora methionotrophica TaxID=121620 RepID=UPI0033F59F9B
MADSSTGTKDSPSLDGPAGDVIAAVVADVLELDAVDPHAGFFDLGASSAAVVDLVRILRGRWPGMRVVDVFDNPTVDQLATFLEPA